MKIYLSRGQDTINRQHKITKGATGGGKKKPTLISKSNSMKNLINRKSLNEESSQAIKINYSKLQTLQKENAPSGGKRQRL